MSDIIIAFERYFERLNEYSSKVFGTKPTVTYTEKLNSDLLVSSPDEDGEVEWSPHRQSIPVDWADIEKSIGFTVCEDLKEFYSSFFFISLSGKYIDSYLNFYPNDGSVTIKEKVIQDYSDAQEFLPHSQCFLIGNAVINEDDSYFIYFDNTSSELFCYESDTHKRLMLAHSIAEIIDGMEARL